MCKECAIKFVLIEQEGWLIILGLNFFPKTPLGNLSFWINLWNLVTSHHTLRSCHMQLVPHHESWKKTKKKVSNYSWKLYYKKLRPNERPEECETKNNIQYWNRNPTSSTSPIQRWKFNKVVHDIIHIPNNVPWDREYLAEYFIIQDNVRNILHNIVSPTKHCYGFEYC